jgi:uncharacterized protein YbaR (Trm112 family)/SAM-dependent methyltransferase
MGLLTKNNLRWLNERFKRNETTGLYLAHAPIYGLYSEHSSPGGHLVAYARIYNILKQLNQRPFNSLLDVGGAEGFVSFLVGKLFDVPVVTSDIAIEPCLRAQELFNLEGIVFDSQALPIKDEAFDVVLCSEVIEHLEYPIEAIFELLRVAKKYLIITTEEIYTLDWARDEHLKAREYSLHFEKNLFTLDDFALLFNGGFDHMSQFHYSVEDRAVPTEKARAAIQAMTNPNPLLKVKKGVLRALVALLTSMGGKKIRQLVLEKNLFIKNPQIIIKQKQAPANAAPQRRHKEKEILDFLFSVKLDPHAIPNPIRKTFNPALLSVLCCPMCQGDLSCSEGAALRCAACAKKYEIRNGIPVLLPDEAYSPDAERLRNRLSKSLGYRPEHTEQILRLRSKFEL